MPQDTALQPGSKAPDFCLASGPESKTSLADYRGKRVVLMFYPADWSPVCGDETVLYNEILPDITALNAQLLGISVDGPWCHEAYARAKNLKFPLLADFEPKGAVARQFGVYREADGISERALFVIDEQGIIRWTYVSPIDQNPGADGVLTALESLNQGASV
ncbi:MAG TPA: redoxin domain-containing protein [Tepidisphaeraceae bacterium]|jgi:peroxiredoxin